MVERITSGANAGFFTLPRSLLNDELRSDVIVGERDLYTSYKNYQIALTIDDLVYYRYSPGPGKTIKGFNRTLLPYIDGVYYVRRSSSDVRRLLYSLENQLIPSSGNTELFNIDYSQIDVPDSYRPYFLDPCVDDWCKQPVPPAPSVPTPAAPLRATFNLLTLVGFALIIGVVVVFIINVNSRKVRSQFKDF